jgi:2-keto-4-pentenoate hydratase/2-oxohepta-3-ene-1,7-dioic acid hydratase in catechol pathway
VQLTARVHVDGGIVEARIVEGMVRRLDGSELGPVQDVRFAPPCVPTKVVGVGRNYASLLAARGTEPPSEPWVFLKGPNAVVGSGDPVLRPAGQAIDFEAEIGLVIGRRASRLTAADWRAHVRGITAANDMTVRAWQAGAAQWWRAKSSDTFCPLGPAVLEGSDLEAPIGIKAWVDGELRQSGSTAELHFGFGEILAFITRTVTLEPGDVVLTGSPAGAGPVDVGSVLEVEVEGVGRLTNPVMEAS